jgi:choline-sulfatase
MLKKVLIAGIVSVLALSGAMLFVGRYAGHRSDISKRHNVFLITIETTRADHLSCYGYKRETTPNIDKFAEDGILFSNMFVQRGETWPSLTSIMTSLYPVNHHVRANGHMLPSSIVSIAEIMAENGYACCAAVAPNASPAEWRGFDYLTTGRDRKLTQRAIGWLRENRENNMFLWVHYLQPHKPYKPPRPYNRLFDPDYKGKMNGTNAQMDEITINQIELDEADLYHIIALHDGCIRFIDGEIKKILSMLKKLELYDDSIIIITADHGEDLYQHNYYFYHGASVYDSSLHVPFIIKIPGSAIRDKRISDIVESIDIAPTILQLVNIPVPADFEGHSMLPLIYSEDSKGVFRHAYSEWKEKILTLRTMGHRYVYNPNSHHPRSLGPDVDWSYFIDREEMYDIRKDPMEQNNIASSDPIKAHQMQEKMTHWYNFRKWREGQGLSQQNKGVRKEIKKRLRAFGYIQ